MKRKEKDKKKRMLTVNFVFVLVVFLIVGFSQFKSFQTRDNSVPTPTPDPMSDWLTYTSLEYNFSFKYPANFGKQGAISAPATGTVETLRSFTDPESIKEEPGSYFNGFSVFVVTKLGTTFDTYLKKEIQAMNAAKSTIMNNPENVVLENGVALVSQSGNLAYYYLPTPDKKIIVVFAYLQADPSFKATFDNILSTFRFINTKSEKANRCYAETACDGNSLCMANPAAVFCTCMGGEGKIVEGETGQRGVCLVDGKEWDEWEYFRSFSFSQ